MKNEMEPQKFYPLALFRVSLIVVLLYLVLDFNSKNQENIRNQFPCEVCNSSIVYLNFTRTVYVNNFTEITQVVNHTEIIFVNNTEVEIIYKNNTIYSTDCPESPQVPSQSLSLKNPSQSFFSYLTRTRKDIYGDHICHSVSEKNFPDWLVQCSKGQEFVWLSFGDHKYYQSIVQYFDMTEAFGYQNNSFLICLDSKCKMFCERYSFPCYFDTESTMEPAEMVNYIKLTLLPNVLRLGLNVFLIDLDVSFSSNPLEFFLPLEDESWDIQFQNDAQTFGAVNVGLMFMKGNEKTAKLFDDAAVIRENTGLADQRCVQSLLKDPQWILSTQLKFTVEWDKLKNLMYFQSQAWERGGADANEFLKGAIGYHSTCYETPSLKNIILQLSGAWWVKEYCSPEVQTLSFDSLFHSQVPDTQAQLYSIIKLTLVLNRTLRFPHIIMNNWAVPFFKLVHLQTLVEADFPYVENGYYYRCNQITNSSPTRETIQVLENETLFELISRIQKRLEIIGPIQDLHIQGRVPLLEDITNYIPFQVQFCPAFTDGVTPSCLRYCK